MARRIMGAMQIRTILLLLLLILSVKDARTLSPAIFESGPDQVPLLELYTSQGCSSCPPADKWLGRLRNEPELWRRFVPVAFHVDYWDYLGWKDPLAQAAFTKRQRRYSHEWRAQSIYTPGFVVSGKEWRRWGGRFKPESFSEKNVGTLSASFLGEETIYVQFKSKKRKSALIVFVAMLGIGIEHDVTAGENRGRRLSNDFAVINLKKQKLNYEGNIYSGQFEVEKPQGLKMKELGVAIWVEEESVQVPIQATGGMISRS